MRRHWTLTHTVHDTSSRGVPYTYKRPRVLRIPGVCAMHGAFVFDTTYLLIGVTAWTADPDGGTAGARVGVGPFCWEIYTGRLLSRRAVERRAARELVEQAEQHLRDVVS